MEGPEVKKSRMNIDSLDTVNSIKEMEFKLKMEENILKLYEELDKEKSENSTVDFSLRRLLKIREFVEKVFDERTNEVANIKEELNQVKVINKELLQEIQELRDNTKVLPREILCIIFSFLDKRSRKSATAASRLWFDVIRNDSNFSNHICYNNNVENLQHKIENLEWD